MKLREKIDGGKREESETANGMDLMKTGCMKLSNSKKKMSKKVKIALASFIPFCLLIYFLTVCSG